MSRELRPVRSPLAERWRGLAAFLVLAAAGLWYVKWDPLYHKAFVAAAHHSIGGSFALGRTGAIPAPSWQAAVGYALPYFQVIWQAALLGILLGAAVQVLIPRDWLIRLLGRGGWWSTAAAGAAALPGMMCTCCSAPVVVGLRRSQVSPGAALAFWLGNPLLNPATLVFIGFVLSWQWALLRLVAGAALVFGAAFWIGRLAPQQTVPVPAPATPVPSGRRSLALEWIRAVGNLSERLLPVYVLLVLLVGALRAWLLPLVATHAAWGLGSLLLLTVGATLFVVPTAGEVPIVQTLLHLGLGAAPAGVLLIALPALSLPSLAMVGRAFSRGVLAAAVGAVVLVALAAGASAGVLGL